ncbi:hypothetical protein HZS55_09155 [Halosimplex rubrum]|uniref:Uncharacterized protein n=1 Tax=Halosimplex rubrum TaxID=869889 RepID=A0A7D5TLE9_9EURY|nr:hypothetical protein [Halosimplex rubrum]QLH77452.1 hypothetical protein HZS55_09155 [Halosimplex rubrum]
MIPNDTKRELLDEYLSNATIRVLLLDDSQAYSFDVDNHDFVDDVLAAGAEMSGSGYARQTLQNVSVTVDDTDDEGVFDADDVTISNIDAGTIQAVVVYEQVGGDDSTPGDDRVLAVHDDATVGDLPLDTNGSDIQISWPAEGIINIS